MKAYGKSKYEVLGFFAREHGLEGLKALIDSLEYNPAIIFTHRRKTKVEDPSRSDRPEFQEYERLAQEHNFELYPVDNKRDIEFMNEKIGNLNYDLIASISWRKLIPKEQITAAHIGGINLHRGRLPEYAGAEPIKKAILNGDNEVYISAHILTEQIDDGEVVSTIKHPLNYDSSKSLEDNIERVKKELTPYFGPLLLGSLNVLTERNATK